jgi:ornithine decarboxylase
MIEALRPHEPVYCWHPEVFADNAAIFRKSFPGTTMYAVKCNPHPYVLQHLYDQGIRHFDTASMGEIRLIKSMFPDAVCYFMHPIKSREAIREAFHQHGVRHFVLDHEWELTKLMEEIDVTQTTIYLRLAPQSTTAVYDFSKKFGANPTPAVPLLQKIAASGAKPAISFHIGSQCSTPSTFIHALEVTGTVLSHSGVQIAALDVGGGFPAEYDETSIPSLETFFEAIEEGVAGLNLPYKPALLCEPGRALVVDAMSLVVQVQLRKRDSIYINDSVYGSFSEVWTGKLGVYASLYRSGEPVPSDLKRNFTVYGCTCDSVDVLPIQFHLPEDVREGDWVVVEMIGAYSNAITSRFNGFFPDTYVVIDEEKKAS